MGTDHETEAKLLASAKSELCIYDSLFNKGLIVYNAQSSYPAIL